MSLFTTSVRKSWSSPSTASVAARGKIIVRLNNGRHRVLRTCQQVALGLLFASVFCAAAQSQPPIGAPYGPPAAQGQYPTTTPGGVYQNQNAAFQNGAFQNGAFQNGAQQQQPYGQQSFAQQEFEGAMRIATVGDEVVFARDVLPRIDKVLAKYRDTTPPAEFEKQRWLFVQKSLQELIAVKRVMQDFKRTVPEDRLPVIREQIDESFEKNRLPQLLEAFKVNSRSELEAKLREEGTSIKREQDKYFESSLTRQWLRQQVSAKAKFSYNELMAYYQDHQKDFAKPAQVRWQQLSVQFAKHASKAEAYGKLAEMGNAALQGVPFKQIAIKSSDGMTAKEGGVREWTKRGVVASDQLEQALFSLPPSQLSAIIEGANAFHIVLVLERVDHHVTPFRDAQVKIHERLAAQARKEASQEYQDRLLKEIRVWTVFDDPEFVQRIGMQPGPPRR